MRRHQHLVEIDANHRINGVDKRHGIRTARFRGSRRVTNVGDIRRQFDDHRQAAILFAPAGDHFDIFRYLADRRAHPALAHAMRATEVKLDTVCPRGFYLWQNGFPRFFFAGHHDRHHYRPVGPAFFDAGNLFKVDGQRTVSDELDIIQPQNAPIGPE